MNNVKELISIILPAYNAAGTIERTLSSLTRQTYSNIEVLCINDGSSDDTLSVLKKWSENDSRIRIFTQENGGPARARNMGLKHMRGQYLMFCDADDWYEPDMCEVMQKIMEQYNVDYASCRTNIHETFTSQMGSDKIVYEARQQNLNGKYHLTDQMRLETTAFLWNKIFKTHLIRKYGISFPDGYEHDDKSFIFQYVFVSCTGYFSGKKLYNHMIRSGSIMDRFYKNVTPEKKLDELFALIYLWEFMERNRIVDQREDCFFSCLENELRDFIWRNIPKLTLKKEALSVLSYFLRDKRTLNPYETHILSVIQHNNLLKAWLILDNGIIYKVGRRVKKKLGESTVFKIFFSHQGK